MNNVIIPEEMFAEKINTALRTNNISLLNRVLVAKCEIDMDLIKKVYKLKYNNELRDDVMARTSGLYQKLCLYLVDRT